MDTAYKSFLGLEPQFSDPKKSKAAVILAPLENTTSFQRGTAAGPAAFIRASQQVEWYDIESKEEFAHVGVSTFEALNLEGQRSEAALKLIESEVKRALDLGLWPLTVGGEHSVSLGAIRALKNLYKDLSVLQIDAHADLRDTYEGSKFSHACVMRRVHELGCPITSFGVRNYSKEEAEYIDTYQLKVFHDHDIRKHGVQAAEVSQSLSPHVYLSIDVDGFSPEEVPGTGTPEPGGINWWQAQDLLKHIFKHHNVVGVDFVELMPLAGSARSEFFVAKLAYKILGYKFFPQSL